MLGYKIVKTGNKPEKELGLTKVNKQEIMPYPPESFKPLIAQDVVDQVNLIKEIQKKVMVKDIHYGVIPGCGDKPTLLKAGAEKICLTFRLAPDVAEQNDLSTPDMIRYRVKIHLLRIADGQFVGSGVGECSSAEEKFAWKKAYKEEYEATPSDKRKIKKTQWGDKYMVRTNPFDNANTILKIAKKRAFVDAVLTATGASDLFTQDIEEMEHLANGEPPDNGQRLKDDLDKTFGGSIPKEPTKIEFIDDMMVKKIEESLKLLGQGMDAEFCIDLGGIASIDKLPKNKLEEARNWMKAMRIKKGVK